MGIKADVLHTEWNKVRTAYYADPTSENERRMDDALRALLKAKEEEQREPAEVLCR